MKRPTFVRLLLLTAFLALPSWLNAQETRTVTGHVVAAESMQPLSGVQVTVRGTNIGTVTDGQGEFSLRVPQSAQTLVFTYLGYRTEEVPVSDRVEVELSQQAIGLEGITVTALGLRREKRSLGYSVQDVQGDDLAEVPEYNLVNALQGQVAGVQITDAGPTGGSSRIVIRGASSITGNNQPLFVIDGVPLINTAPRNQGYGGIDYGNAASDIDPANIESISVLKGPNAAALYGSRAANGAIVITTKSGRGAADGGLAINASMSMTFEQPLRLPEWQDLYGQGIDGEFRFVDGEGGGLWDFVDESWGPRMDGRLIDQFTGAQQPWLPHPDNVNDFFETGRTLNLNAAVSRAGERSNVRLSVTNSLINGMSPGNRMERMGVQIKGGAEVSERITADASLNYINMDALNRPGTGYDEDNPMQSFIWFGRQVDMNALRDYNCDGDEPTPCIEGGQYNWNYNYHNNPFWEALVNRNWDQRDRLIGNVSASYAVNDWITVTGRVGRDWFRDYRKNVIAFHSLDDAGDGHFNESTRYRSETNMDLLAAATRQLTPDVTLDVTAGGNVRTHDYNANAVSVTQLTVPGIYTIDNAAVNPNPSDYESHEEIRSLYGSVSLNYGGYLNLDVTGRNDWSSTLPEENNSYFYPSVSAAFVFSDALDMRSDFFSSGKIRASWTRVGNDTNPYQLTSVFNSYQTWGAAPLFSVPNQLPNITLKPEETEAWEIGTDLGFFNERLGFVLTYYNRETTNQIMGVQVSRASGYSSQVLNAGAVENTGIELLLRANPVRMDNGFNWDLTLNWAKNDSEVTELYGDLDNLVLGTYWSLNIEARKGYPYGAMFGNPYQRDDQGRIIVGADGYARETTNRKVLGNYAPDWTGGIQNRFSYGPFDLSVLVDGQSGGNVFSVTNMFGNYAGVLEESLYGRENAFGYDENGVAVGESIQPGLYCDPGIIIPNSVHADGTPNTTRICPDLYYAYLYNNHEEWIDDASYVKLREVRLGYELPADLVGRVGFSGGNVALIGRNLWLWSEIDNIDPETAFDASNVQGIEFGQFPTARSIGFSISVRP